MIYDNDTFLCSGCGEPITPAKRQVSIKCACGQWFNLGWESIASTEHYYKNRAEDLILVEVLDEDGYSAPHLGPAEVAG